MRTSIRTIVMIGVAAVAVLASAPAQAFDRNDRGNTGPTSVFPQPRDPWKSWGVRSELPRRVGPPHANVQGGAVVTSPGADTVWVPGQWFWDGATWVWWPGHWGYRY